VQWHTEGFDNEMQVTNGKIGQLEATQFATNTKLTGLETAVSNIDKSLAALLWRFDELHAKTNEQHDDWEDEYIADTEQDEQDAHHRRRLCTNRRGMGGFRRREVRNNDGAFSKIKFKIPPLVVHMTLMHTLLGKLLLIKSLHAMIFLRMHVLGLLLVSSLILLLFGG
jgi:hypothetical protein